MDVDSELEACLEYCSNFVSVAKARSELAAMLAAARAEQREADAKIAEQSAARGDLTGDEIAAAIRNGTGTDEGEA